MEIKLPNLGKLDEYDRRARLYPALFVLLPLLIGAVEWFPTGFSGAGILVSVLAWVGVGYFLANLARDAGKEKEPSLYAMWGGKPTTRLLRHRDNANSAVLRHVHQRLGDIFPEITLPTQQDEANDPSAADNIYDLCTRRLKERTRDKQKFVILFGENCSYGFRRNLWGMKATGITFVIAGLLIALAKLGSVYLASKTLNPLATIVLIVDVILLLAWSFRITPQWVRIPAEAYAEHLFASLDAI